MSERDDAKPRHCFCEVPIEELKRWADKRYREQIPTIELLEQAENAHDKEVIGIVAMFDVDEQTMLQLMGDVDKPDHHIIHCRQNVREMLGL